MTSVAVAIARAMAAEESWSSLKGVGPPSKKAHFRAYLPPSSWYVCVCVKPSAFLHELLLSSLF
jgi:hypothetical protein